MENFINSVGIEKIILFVLIFNVVLLIGFIINIIKTNAISKKYKNFMQKLGEGKNIEEDLENYMYTVERVEKQNIEISESTYDYKNYTNIKLLHVSNKKVENKKFKR